MLNIIFTLIQYFKLRNNVKYTDLFISIAYIFSNLVTGFSFFNFIFSVIITYILYILYYILYIIYYILYNIYILKIFLIIKFLRLKDLHHIFLFKE